MTFFLSYQNPILNYHRVGEEGDPTITVSQGAFVRQMSFLKEADRLISLKELVSLLVIDRLALPRKVSVTFDDGTHDNYTNVFPFLRSHQLPVTVFLITEWIGKKGFLSWEEVREMSKEGVEFGSHTKTHAYLPSLPSRKLLEEEIRGSKEILEERLGKEVSLFSYPVGGFTEEIKKMVEEAGYKAAVTTNRGERKAPRDRFALSRIKMTESSTSPLIFQVKTSGYYEQFRRRKSPS